MIRAALVTILFLSVTLTLMLLQPPIQGPNYARLSTGPGSDDAEAVVTRAQNNFDALTALSDSLSIVAASVPDAPTSADPADPQALAAPLPDRSEPRAEIPPEAAQPALADQVAEFPVTAEPAAAPEALESLVATAVGQGQNPAYIDALVNDAATKGKVTVPAALILPDGRVNTSSLLAALGQPSVQPEPALPRLGMSSSYTVQPGDSLAAIAYRFYGETDLAGEIFAANRSILSSPDHVEVGQRLVIPAL